MRILMVSGIYLPVIGGTELHVQILATELRRRGHDVAVATLGDGKLPRFRVEEGLPVYRLDGWSRVLRPFYTDPARRFPPPVPDLALSRALTRICRERQIQIVHAHDWMLYSVLPIKRLAGVRVAMTLHDFSLSCIKQTYLNHRKVCTGRAFLKCVRCASEQYGSARAAGLAAGLYSVRPLNRLVDQFISVSSAVAEAGRADGVIPDGPIEIIPSPVKTDVSALPDRPSFLPPHDGYLLFVGALSRHKGIDVLLEAYAELGRDVSLVLIGTPRDDTPRVLPAGITLVTNIPHSQVMAAWSRCSVGVVPSVCPEGFGKTAVEAMACGRPVVASAVGGLAEIVVDGKTGILCPPGDPQSLRNAIRRLLDDPSLATAMGKAGRDRAPLYATEAVGNEVERVFQELLASPSRKAAS
jgi:glycosyltransferase involved in cell wall biosynthesis